MIKMDTQKETQKNDYASLSKTMHNVKVIGSIAAGTLAAVGVIVKSVPKLRKKK